ncbi:MAG: S1C family serine protease [Kofleriaceae bacterium]
MRGSGLWALTLLVACGASSGQAPQTRLTPKDIVQQSTAAIVRIEVTDKTLGDRVGTGFIVDKSGVIVTNLHVVAGTKDIDVKLHDGTPYKVTQVVGLDAGHDLALLRIKPAKPLPTVRLGDSNAMTAGDQIIAIGNPLGVFDYSVSSGLVSAVRQICTEAEKGCPPGGLTMLQISAPISQGSSGGPLFNQFGEVVGVTTLIVPPGQSINFAMPANYLRPMVARPIAMSMEKFASHTEKLTEREADESGDGEGESSGPIVRKIPDHNVKVLDGCSDADVNKVVTAISEAIDIGAPLYNRGDIEACFRIYEGASAKLERDPPCAGVGRAFGDGLLRASTMTSFKEKAWALRDTFDGMIRVAMKRMPPSGPAAPGAPGAPKREPAPAAPKQPPQQR